ncbi:HPr family phosphocarrier protein [Nocardiopsis algeriensis]|uniref:Phosphocarrier protein HPr n=1 Tax=Nocardiopsis algeriensis TaxID=1478215 RepID=A0A841IPF5_9ACTN|nr:HPr family phosphocarrier protein [Nocardiopsis algeriensis]MBB6118231.1 phosphocarrier protein [Nocardiopsis algeriensis]
MPQRTAAVGSVLGLHARPATLFVQAVNATGLPVTIAAGDRDPVDARSLLAVMSLGVKHGDEVTLACEDGENADKALDELAALLASDLDA